VQFIPLSNKDCNNMARNNLILLKCKLCGLSYVLLATTGRKEKKKGNDCSKHLLFYIKNDHLYRVLASEAFSVSTPS